MFFLQKTLAFSTVLASLGGAYAELDVHSGNNVIVYWGQNSADSGQKPLANYCKDSNINVIILAFLMQVNGRGGAPMYDFSVTSKPCPVFSGTDLKNCPSIGDDITTCQNAGKTILLSLGGATYTEGGFQSEADAINGANLVWRTFGPPQSSTNSSVSKAKTYRPFGNASIDGIDFDFEATVQNTLPFAQQLRKIMDSDGSGKPRFLTAAPQCMYPDLFNQDILNGPVSLDAVWAQFYNNFCGLSSFDPNADKQTFFNFDQWNNWAKNISHNPDVRVMLGVPAGPTAAGSGYEPPSKLAPIIQYTKTFDSFGGVMMWDVAQAYANNGFLDAVRSALTSTASRVQHHVVDLRRRFY